ncbi:hypothetical protein ACVWXQ_007137 [Bradyrhizobium sp. S3.14.4]
MPSAGITRSRPGHGHLQFAVESAIGREAERAGRNRDHLALLDARLHDLDVTAGGLDLAEALRPRLWGEVGEARDLRTRVRLERLGEQGMNALDAALRDVQHGLDHRMIRPRPVCEATVQLDLLGARERHLHAAVETIDDGIVEHDGGAIRHRRQAEHAAAALAPIHHEGVLRDAVGEIVAGAENSAMTRLGS